MDHDQALFVDEPVRLHRRIVQDFAQLSHEVAVSPLAPEVVTALRDAG